MLRRKKYLTVLCLACLGAGLFSLEIKTETSMNNHNEAFGLGFSFALTMPISKNVKTTSSLEYQGDNCYVSKGVFTYTFLTHFIAGGGPVIDIKKTYAMPGLLLLAGIQNKTKSLRLEFEGTFIPRPENISSLLNLNTTGRLFFKTPQADNILTYSFDKLNDESAYVTHSIDLKTHIEQKGFPLFITVLLGTYFRSGNNINFVDALLPKLYGAVCLGYSTLRYGSYYAGISSDTRYAQAAAPIAIILGTKHFL